MNTTLIVYFHSNRIDNLRQTIRFLEYRDPLILANSILVCQDRTHEKFPYEVLNLDLPVFNKSIMANQAVKRVKTDKIILLDGDRILPKRYFTNMQLPPKTIISVKFHYKLNFLATDQQIDKEVISRTPDFRCIDINHFSKHLHTKGMFSGNTMMWKKDYEEAGGMDESFEDYGFSDTDFMFSTRHLKFQLTNDKELHLWHPNLHSKEDFGALNTKNGLKFCRKWNITPPHGTRLAELYHGAIPFI